MTLKLLKKFIGFSAVFFILTSILQPIIAFSNPQLGGDIETQLLKIQRDDDTQPDLLKTLLMISKHWKPSLDLAPLQKEVEKLMLSAQKKSIGQNNPLDIIRTLRTVIHDEAGYAYTDKVDERGVPINPEELFLHGLLNTRKGYCMNLSLLYLILGQKLGLPLYGVALPNHFFVRYEKKDVQINIETTEQGVSYPDTFYRQRFGFSGENKKSYFMKNLDTRQTLGAYFSNVGMVYYQNQKHERAVFYLGLSTTINPASIDAQNNLANIYSELKEPQLAIKHYNLALKADPGNTSTLFNRGLIHQESGDLNQAINDFLQVVQIDPGFSPAHRMLANLYRQKNQLTSALLHLKILARGQPMNLQNHLNIASTYRKMGKQKLSIETLKKVQTQFPDNSEIHEGLAESYYRLEDFQQSIVQYRFLIDQDSTQLRNYIQLGWTYYRLSDLPMAEAWTLRGMKKSQGTDQLMALAKMNLGFYSLLQKKYKLAKEWYGKILSENPPAIAQGMIQDIEEVPANYSLRADLHFFKGWIYFKSRQPKKSQHSLQTYLQMEKNGPFSEEANNLLKVLDSGNGKAKGIIFPTQKTSGEQEQDMALIPSGFFIMGSNKSLEDEGPEHRVYLDGYWIDKYEVSAKNFAEFLNAVDNEKGYYLDNKFGTLVFDGKFHPRPGLENHPINNVTWNAAKQYCKWRKKRLPTEAEWEKAARGTSAQMFPWGNTPPSDTLARYFQTWTEEKNHHVMLPVQALTEGQSPYGLHHMAGNVKEWVDDWYDREYYKEQSEYANPRGPIGGEFKVVRGGSWRDLTGFIYSSFRNSGNPNSRMDDYGFRCAKNAAPTSGDKKLTNRVVPPNKG
jgi:formylglycine-generating enzyme required for sulfatase activity/regulator of sirC expression with transglutaminase-like and TPR domain